MKILVVDDEVKIADILSERFRLRGVDAVPVYNGKSALEAINREPFDGIVLDLRLPDINGMEVLRQVMDDFPNIKVIILSGHGTDKDFKNCLKMGAIQCFHKPANIQKLSEAFSKNWKIRDEDT